MRREPLVTIITVSRNSEKTIRNTIESVLHQTWSHIEYVIVDGGSTDGTLDIMKEYMPYFGKRMRYISEKDKGIYNAMNKGIRMAHGQLIGILNSDDFYEPDAVETVVKELLWDQCQVIYGYMQVLKGNTHKWIAKENHKNLKNEMIPHPACFVTRKTYQKYGLFLEWFRVAADYELMLRLYGKEDVTFTQVRKVLTDFRLGGASSDQKYSMEREIARMMHGGISFGQFGEKVFLFLMDQFT